MPVLEQRENILKGIVYDINEFIKKVRKVNHQKKTYNIDDFITNNFCFINNAKDRVKCEGFNLKFSEEKTAPYQFDCQCVLVKKKYSNLCENNFAINKIESHWPLKKGMVETRVLAWQQVLTPYDSVQSTIAFMIKCISVAKYKSNKSSTSNKSFKTIDEMNLNNEHNYLFSMNELILGKGMRLYFWNEIKKYYQTAYKEKQLRSTFVNEILPKKCLIVLCLEEAFFRLRSGTNMELFAFEQFINDMVNSDNSLVVFSTQKLLQETPKNENFALDYTISFKKNSDEMKISLKQAMEPDYRVAQDERFIEANRLGGFDRLLELLAKGQNFIYSLEEDFFRMEDKNRELSADYYKRKHHLLKKRLAFFFILVSSVSFLLFLSFSEGWALRVLLSSSFSSAGVSGVLIAITVYLLVYNIILSRITLRICYHFDNKKIPSAIIMAIFIFLYLLISINTSEVKNIISLGMSKLFIISLYFNFWNSQLTETRLQMRSGIIPYVFIVSWHAFFICRWVLVACWLLSSLGFALALVSSHPIIKLEGWEGLLLMVTFYFLFRLFVRNPNAHANY